MRQILTTALLIITLSLRAQELFIQSEPASNMPARTWGLRLGSDTWDNGERLVSRIGFEGMYGITKDLMFHIQGFGSNQFNGFEAETRRVAITPRCLASSSTKLMRRSRFFEAKITVVQPSKSTPYARHFDGRSTAPFERIS